ncbi:MAG: AMP-binding protein, partial [Pseudomonadota bacterium]
RNRIAERNATPAFIYNGAPISARQLNEQVRDVSAALTGRARYAINLCKCRYQFTLGFAGSILGGLTNLLPANRQVETVTRVAERYPKCLVLHDNTLEDELRQQISLRDISIINLLDTIGPSSHSHEPVAAVAPEQLAAIVFTSGSTGDPVAITKPWGTLVATTELLRQRFVTDFLSTPSPSIVATVPPQHMYGLETTVLMALRGDCLVSAEQPFYPADIAAALAAIPSPRVLVTTPLHMKSLLQSAQALPELAMIISATAPLERSLAEEAERLWQCQVTEIYGCSEAGSLASRHTVTDDDWQLLDGMVLQSPSTADKQAVHVSAPHLEQDVPLQDRLDVLSPQSFRFLGRSADMVNIAGKRASLTELTAQLQAIDGVTDGVFFLRDVDKRGMQRLAALVVSDSPEAEIVNKLASFIDPAFMPRPLKKVEAIPRNSLSKVPREALLRAIQATNHTSSTAESA